MPDDRPLLVYRRLLAYLGCFRGRILLTMAILGVHAGAALAFPWLTKNLFYDAILTGHSGGAYAALGLILLVMLVMNLAQFLSTDQIEIVSLGLLERLRNDLVAKIMRLPAGALASSRSGDALSRVFNDVPVLKSFLNYAFYSVGSDLLRTVGSIGILFFLSWRLSLLTLVIGVIGGVVMLASSRLIRRRFHRVQSALGDMNSLLSEQVRAIQTIQAYGTGEEECGRFARSSADYGREAVLGNRIHAASQATLNSLAAGLVVFVLGSGMGEIHLPGQEGPARLPLEQLVGFTLYAGLLAEPITRLSRTNFEIQRALAAGRHIVDFLDAPEEAAGDGGLELPARPQGMLRFENVHFQYAPEKPVLDGIDLTIRRGETVAVVGTSGAGKSTLTQLALRFHQPSVGRVTLDGHDVRDLRIADLRRHIGWVGQDPFLFRGTIAENIRYGCGNVSSEDVERAARLACADAFIRQMPNGYDTHIAERGGDLSGGQRARLALARVILRGSTFVILDEVTASLDTETEVRLWKGLENWLAERTTLIIAHRLMTVIGRHRIVVLDEGRIVGDGAADELRRSCPAFNRIFQEQMDAAPRAA